MNKSWIRIFALIQKETSQLLRDRRTLLYIIGLPLLELFLFAYTVSLTVYHLPTAIADQSQDAKSRDLIKAFVDSTYFDYTMSVPDEAAVRQALDAGKVKAGIIIPPDFASHLANGDASILILLDGSNSFSVQSGYSAANLVSQNYGLQISTQETEQSGGQSILMEEATSLPITNSFSVLYNPDFRDLWFVLPAIIGMLLQTAAVSQAALIIVREREIGTIEQILATPTRPLELLIGKLIPLLVLCFFILGIILFLGVFWFGVAFKGSLGLYFLLSFLLHHVESRFGIFDFHGCQESTPGAASQHRLDVIQHVADRCGLSAQHHAADSAMDRQHVAAHVFHPHFARHHYEGRGYVLSLVGYGCAGSL